MPQEAFLESPSEQWLVTKNKYLSETLETLMNNFFRR